MKGLTFRSCQISLAGREGGGARRPLPFGAAEIVCADK